MIEVDTTYLWQMPSGVEPKSLCASIPVSSISDMYTDMKTVFVSTFFISGNTSLPRISA